MKSKQQMRVEIQTEDREPVAPRTQTVVKKSGTGLSLLAILIYTWRGWCRLLFWSTTSG